MQQASDKIIRSIMLRPFSLTNWRSMFRMTAVPLTKLASSSATAATGPLPVPCQAEDTSDKAAENSAVKSRDAVKVLGSARRKALVAAAMDLSSPEPKTAHETSGPVSSQDTGVEHSDVKKGGYVKVSAEKAVKELRKPRVHTMPPAAGDLKVVLGITGDDEAARMVPSLSLDQKIRVMSKLSSQRRRSVTLLRSLAASITAENKPLELKQAADVLSAAATLNFPDGPLLERAASDAGTALSSSHTTSQAKASAVRSVAISIGLLRYRNIELLEHLSDWTESQFQACRPQDLTGILLTFATVNYTPSNADELFQAVLPLLKEVDFPGPFVWLDAVWALCVLGKVTPEQAASVLSSEFLLRLARASGDSLNEVAAGAKLKLLNVNAAAQYLLPNYKGPLLSPTSDVSAVPLARSKERQTLVRAVLDALTNLLPSATYLRSDINTGMGFLLDAECMIDSKCNPLPLHIPDTKTPSHRGIDRKGTKVAVIVWGYPEVCRGRGSVPPPGGPAALAERLLAARGYHILRVHHVEFTAVGDSLVKRVQFLEKRLKQLASTS